MSTNNITIGKSSFKSRTGYFPSELEVGKTYKLAFVMEVIGPHIQGGVYQHKKASNAKNATK